MLVDTLLQQRETAGYPIRVGMVGAGAAGRSVAPQLGKPVPGVRLVAIANRTVENAERAFREAGVQRWRREGSVREAEEAIGGEFPVLSDDPSVLIGCDAMVDYHRTPETQRAFAERNGLDAKKATSFANPTKLSMEATVLANATGFHVGCRGMYGSACENVREIGQLLPADEMLSTGLVDYALGAAPYTGAFVIVYEDSPLKKAQLAYYKLGDGPFYVFYTPYHLPHIQIASTIGRAVLHQDPTVAPVAGPVCEVISIAKRDLKAGGRLDGVGGFCTYGLVENVEGARKSSALPMGLSEGCVLLRDVAKDNVISFDNVTSPLGQLSEALWREQAAHWSLSLPTSPAQTALQASDRMH
jgi:predicted homoserine dehydrogenase-like protein